MQIYLSRHIISRSCVKKPSIIFIYLFFLVSKNPYDLGSQIRFRILLKKRTLCLMTFEVNTLHQTSCQLKSDKHVERDNRRIFSVKQHV